MSKKQYHIYCDESCIDRRYMVLGGIIIPAANFDNFNDSMAGFRKETGMNAELKWGKISEQKEAHYQRFIDYFFALNNSNKAHFHAIMFDSHQFNHKKYNQGDKETGFYKFYYQLLFHCFVAKYYKRNTSSEFHIYLDHRTTKYKLGDLKKILNNSVGSKFGLYNSPVLTVEPRDSKKSEVLQIVDLLIGAVGFQKNGADLIAGAKQSKVKLAAHISMKAGLKNLCEGTPKSLERFSLWNFMLQKR